jgi:hypothetical protein
MNKTTNMTAREKYEAAVARARDAEARNLSTSTLNRRWREVFAAEDAMKAVDGWR